jgi:hypothetical protein
MQVTLPDDPKISSNAAAGGYRTVDEFVRHVLEEKLGPLSQPGIEAKRSSGTEWKRRLDDLLASVEPGNPNVDDSRESIYPVR